MRDQSASIGPFNPEGEASPPKPSYSFIDMVKDNPLTGVFGLGTVGALAYGLNRMWRGDASKQNLAMQARYFLRVSLWFF
jgi:hypothetical protein